MKKVQRIALRAAQTGHLVLSTLHTNDAISAISRLQQLGIQQHESENSLLLVIAQRLVRKICPKCGGNLINSCDCHQGLSRANRRVSISTLATEWLSNGF